MLIALSHALLNALQCSSSSFCRVEYGSNDMIIGEGDETVDSDDSCNVIACLVSAHAKLNHLQLIAI